MSRESKIFSVRNKKDVGDRVKEYESFGWELLSINGLDVSLSRETQNSVYSDLVKYEYQYEELREELEALQRPIPYKSFDFGLFLLCTLAFIVPGILYIVFYYQKKNKYIEKLNVYEQKNQELLNKIKKVCDDSRNVFFSRQK